MSWDDPHILFRAAADQAGQIEVFPISTSPEGDILLSSPNAVTPTQHVRRLGRLTLHQVRQALFPNVADPWEAHGEVRKYTDKYDHYRAEPISVEATLHDETQPYITTEERAEIETLLEDTDEMNRRFTGAGRPDLVMRQRAQMEPVNSLEDLYEKNNFIPNLAGVGFQREGEERELVDMLGVQRYRNLRPPTDDEYARLTGITGLPLNVYSEDVLSREGRGLVGFSAKQLERIVMYSHVNRKYFGRMMILFPDLTKRILNDSVGKHPHDLREDALMTAYQVMSRLVDMGDSEVLYDAHGTGVLEPDRQYLTR